MLDEELAKIVNVSMALEMPLAAEGRAGHRQDHAGPRHRREPGDAAHRPERQVEHEAAGRALPVRHPHPPQRQPLRRFQAGCEQHRGIHPDGQDRPGLRRRRRTVLLIDEIDKADTDFQDDMLDVLDQMQFDIIEIDKTVQRRHPARDHHHLQRQEGPFRSLPRPLQFPSHRLSRAGYDAPHHGRPFPGSHRDDLAKACHQDLLPAPASSGGSRRSLPPGNFINWIRALQADPDFRIEALSDGDASVPGGPVQEEQRSGEGRAGTPLPESRVTGQEIQHMFVPFFYTLRDRGVAVTPTSFLRLQKALSLGLVASLDDFYIVARSILVKSERDFDTYDQVFAELFAGAEAYPAEECGPGRGGQGTARAVAEGSRRAGQGAWVEREGTAPAERGRTGAVSL
ncbi:MAG: hypothetical protein MZU95_16955 [Desulfomicrobium escambiense]|nr:hypothetical protein [Desulfomicrobium escambiense]